MKVDQTNIVTGVFPETPAHDAGVKEGWKMVNIKVIWSSKDIEEFPWSLERLLYHY